MRQDAEMRPRESGEDDGRTESTARDARAPIRTCPNCGCALSDRSCQLVCPNPACGYYLSCSDFL